MQAVTPRPCTKCGDHPELISKKGKRRSWCLPCLNAFNYELRQRNPEQYRLARRKANLRRYGLTPEQYEEMFEAQGRCCAICGTSEERERRTNGRAHLPNLPGHLAVDHDGRTGHVRGILCGPCNRALGLFGHDPERIRAAAAYLVERSAP